MTWTATVATDRIDIEIPISFSPKPNPPSRMGVKQKSGWIADWAPPKRERTAKENMMALIWGVNNDL